MEDIDWMKEQPGRCYFMNMRDCPGWAAGGICARLNVEIPEDAEADE